MFASTNLDKMNVVALCAISSLIIVLPILGADGTELASDPRRKCGVTLEIIEQRMDPVIKRSDPGTEGIEHGIEGGVVLKLGSTYHLFTTELCGREWVNTRIAHWTSENRLNWKRRSTVFESSGDFTGKDVRASLWAKPVTVR